MSDSAGFGGFAGERQLEALGRVASVIAHELTNLLQILASSLERLAVAHDPDDATVKTVRASLERGTRLARQLQTFAQTTPPHQQFAELHQLIAGWMPDFEAALGPSHRLELRLRHSGAALVDAEQIETALINLLLNAREASPPNSVVTIELSKAEQPTGGSGCRIAVIDHGEGMTDDVLRQAVVPFFTTRAAGKGMGLGLTIARMVAEAHGGALDIDTAYGRGTTVAFYLPAYPTEVRGGSSGTHAPAAAGAHAAPHGPPAGGGLPAPAHVPAAATRPPAASSTSTTHLSHGSRTPHSLPPSPAAPHTAASGSPLPREHAPHLVASRPDADHAGQEHHPAAGDRVRNLPHAVPPHTMPPHAAPPHLSPAHAVPVHGGSGSHGASSHGDVPHAVSPIAPSGPSPLFSAPVVPSAPAAPPEPAPTVTGLRPSPFAHASSSGCVLVVDDEEAIADYFRIILTADRYDVHVVTSAYQALDRFAEDPQRYDAVLLDMMLRDGSGIDLYRKFRHLRPDLSVVVCTGFSDNDSLAPIRADGHDILFKPCPRSEVLKAVARAVGRRRTASGG